MGSRSRARSLCVRPDQGQQRLVDVRGDGACPALNGPMFIVDSSGRRWDCSSPNVCLSACCQEPEGLIPRLMAGLVVGKTKLRSGDTRDWHHSGPIP